MLRHISNRKLVVLGGDVLLIVTSFYLSYAIRHGEYINVISKYTLATFLSLFVYIFVFYISDVYNIEGRSYSINNIIRIAFAIFISNSIIAGTFYVFSLWHFSRVAFLLNLIIIIFTLILWRTALEMIVKHRNKPSRIIIVGAGPTGRSLCSVLSKRNDYKVIGYLDDEEKRGLNIGSSKVIGNTNILQSLVKDKDINTIVVAISDIKAPSIYRELINVKFDGVEVYDILSFYERVYLKVPIFLLRDSWLSCTEFYGIRRNMYNVKIKRVLDRLVALFGIVALFPIMIIVSIAIRIETKGPIFFKQERVGEGSRIFKVYKFRTMKYRKENERKYEESKNDTRITKVGRILRFFRIDEIPQLWNVLNGNMSIIGPRALIKEEVRDFSERVPYFSLRHSIRPGITGWAQVNYRHGAEVEDGIEKLQYDLYYIKNLSPVLDLHIFIKTMKVILFGRGAR